MGQEGFLGGASWQGSAQGKEWQGAQLLGAARWPGHLGSHSPCQPKMTDGDPQTCCLPSKQPPPCSALLFQGTPAVGGEHPASGQHGLCQLPAQAACSQHSMHAGVNFVIGFLHVHIGWYVSGSLQYTQLDCPLCPLCPLPQVGSKHFCLW